MLEDKTLVGEIEDPYQDPAGPEEKRVADSFYAAELSPSGDVEGTYNRIQQEYALAGTSDTVEQTRTQQADSAAELRNEFLQDLALNPDSTPEEIEYNARAAIALNEGGVDLMDAYAGKAASIDLSLSANEWRREQKRADPLHSRVDQLRAKAHLLQREIYTGDEEDIGTGRFIVDMLAGVMPFNEAKSVYAVARELGLEPDLIDFARYGDTKKAIIREIKSKSGDDRAIVIAKAKIALQEHSGFLGDNHFIRQVLSDQFTQEMDEDAWYHFVDNFVGVIDVLGVAKFGVATVKAVSRSALHKTSNAVTSIRAKVAVNKGSPISVAKTANPKIASKMAQEAIADESGQVAKKLGTTREEIIEEYAMPTPVVSGSKINTYENIPSNVLNSVLKYRARLTDAYRRSVPDIRTTLNADELTDAVNSVMGKYQAYFGTKVNIPSSRLEQFEDKMTLTAQFQADEFGGWGSITDLFDDIVSKGGSESVEDVTVWHREIDSDDFIDVTNNLAEMARRSADGTAGDFTYSVKIDIPVSPEWKHVLPDNAVAAGMGWWGKFLVGNQMFNKQIRSDFVVAIDRVGFMEKEVGDVLKEAFSNVGGKGINLFKKNADYDDVSKALIEGDRIGHWFTSDELVKKGFTEDQMTAYYGYKEVSDIMWRASSHDLYKTLSREGLASLSFPGRKGDEFIGIFGRGLSLEEAQGHSGVFKGQPMVAYNPATGKTTRMDSPEKVARLYSQGKRIAVPRGGEGGKMGTFSEDGKNYYQFLLVDEARGARIEKLSKFPTPYKEGHVFRSYKNDNYLVKYKNPDAVLNGVKNIDIEDVVGMVRNKAQAEQFIKQQANLRGTNPEDYRPVPTDKWHEGRMQTDDDWALIESSALKSNRARGEHLLGIDNQLAQIENPIEALGRTISAVSNRVGKRDQIDANQAAWMKTYGAKLKGTPKYPKDRAALKRSVDDTVTSGQMSNRLGKEALAYYDYIEMNRGVGAPITDLWERWVFKTMNDTDSKLLKSIAPETAHAVGFLNPALRLKQSAFQLYIALSPLRQLVLQPMQITNAFVLYPEYMSKRFVPEMSALTAELIGGHGGKLGKQLAKEFKASGILGNIDHHQYINQSQVARALTGDELKPFSFRNKLYQTAKLPSKVGFQAGEGLNQMMHWLAARDQYKLANEGADLMAKRHSDAVLFNFRELSGSMNAAGKFGYQGWGRWQGEALSGVLQFMSHSHKMTQMMLPQKFGGARFLSPKQKVQLALGNTVLWGTALFPFVNKMMNEAQDQFPEIEMSEDLNRVIQRGLVDAMIYTGIEVATGEQPDLQISKSFNPTGSIESFASTMYESITNDPLTHWDFAAGVGAGSRILDTIGAINTYWQSDTEAYGTEEMVLKTIEEIANMSSGMSNYGKAIGIVETGKVVSRSGNVIAEANLTAAAAKLFGITLGQEQSYYDLIDIANKQRESYQDMVDDVRHIHEYTNRLLADRDDLSLIDKEKILNKNLARRFPNMNARRAAYEEIYKLRNQHMLDGIDSISVNVMMKAMESGDIDALRGFVRQHPDASPAINKFVDALLNKSTGTE